MTTIPSDQAGGAPRRGGRAREALRHPFWQMVLVLVGSYLLVKFGIAYIPGLLGAHSAPVPHPTSSHLRPPGMPNQERNRGATWRLQRPTYRS